jgi:hypothetical protein
MILFGQLFISTKTRRKSDKTRNKMKKNDFIVAGIVSAVWAILTCIYCGWGNTINLNNQIELGAGWYLPLPNRYWDWLFIGLNYITMAWFLRGQWLPNRKRAMSDKEDGRDATLFFLTFLITCIVATTIIITTHRGAVSNNDISLLMTFACIGTRQGVSRKRLISVVCLVTGINAEFFGWYFASLATLIILVAKILIWLVVNIVRSGFSTAWRQLWTSLILGKNPFDEGNSGNVPTNTVALTSREDYQREARAQ